MKALQYVGILALLLLCSTRVSALNATLSVSSLSDSEYFFSVAADSPVNLSVCYWSNATDYSCVANRNFENPATYVVSGLVPRTVYLYAIEVYDANGTLSFGSGSIGSATPSRSSDQPGVSGGLVGVIIACMVIGALLSAVPFPREIKGVLVGVMALVLIILVFSVII